MFPNSFNITSLDQFIAKFERFTLSVLIYVISHCLVQSHKSIHSYNFCAIIIVCFTQKLYLRLASCCKVDVVKGAWGVLFESFFIISFNLNSILIFHVRII